MAENANIITWNPPNWITITLMVSLSFFIAGAVVKIWKQRRTQATA